MIGSVNQAAKPRYVRHRDGELLPCPHRAASSDLKQLRSGRLSRSAPGEPLLDGDTADFAYLVAVELGGDILIDRGEPGDAAHGEVLQIHLPDVEIVDVLVSEHEPGDRSAQNNHSALGADRVWFWRPCVLSPGNGGVGS